MYSLAITFIVAFATCLLLTPPLRCCLQCLGLVERHEQRRPRPGSIPRTGGLAVLAAAAIGLATPYVFGLEAATQLNLDSALLRPLILPTVLVLLLGVVDDAVGLTPRFKLAVEVMAALVLVRRGVGASALFGHSLASWLAVPATVLWLLLCTNALNLIDGLDGLASGMAIFASSAILAFGLLSGNWPLALIAASLTGALGAFLRFNFFPASIFLGDAGSLTIGFLLGALALVWADKTTTLLGLSAPLLALMIPLLDTAVAVARRWLNGKPLFTGDHNHIHHRLIQRGLNPRTAVLLMYAIAAAAAIGSLFLAQFHGREAELVILFFIVLAWVGVAQLGYEEFSEALRMLRNGALGSRDWLRACVAIRRAAAAITVATSYDEIWRETQEAAKALGFTKIEFVLPTCGLDEPRNPAAQVRRADLTSPVGPASGQWLTLLPLAGGVLGQISLWHTFGDAHNSLAPSLAPLCPVISKRLLALRETVPTTPEHRRSAASELAAHIRAN